MIKTVPVCFARAISFCLSFLYSGDLQTKIRPKVTKKWMKKWLNRSWHAYYLGLPESRHIAKFLFALFGYIAVHFEMIFKYFPLLLRKRHTIAPCCGCRGIPGQFAYGMARFLFLSTPINEPIADLFDLGLHFSKGTQTQTADLLCCLNVTCFSVRSKSVANWRLRTWSTNFDCWNALSSILLWMSFFTV